MALQLARKSCCSPDLFYRWSLFFFSLQIQFLAFFSAALTFCSTFASRQKWKKEKQRCIL